LHRINVQKKETRKKRQEGAGDWGEGKGNDPRKKTTG